MKAILLNSHLLLPCNYASHAKSPKTSDPFRSKRGRFASKFQLPKALFKSKELHLNGSVFHLKCRLIGLGQPAQDAPCKPSLPLLTGRGDNSISDLLMDFPLQLVRDIFHAKTSLTEEDNVMFYIILRG